MNEDEARMALEKMRQKLSNSIGDWTVDDVLKLCIAYGNQRELEGHRYPTREDAQKFAEAIAASDTGLGGWLTMSHSTNSFASLLLQFANPMNYLTELQSQQVKKGE